MLNLFSESHYNLSVFCFGAQFILYSSTLPFHSLSTIIQNSCNSDKGYMVVLSKVMNELSAQNKFFLAKSEMYDLDLHQSIFL